MFSKIDSIYCILADFIRLVNFIGVSVLFIYIIILITIVTQIYANRLFKSKQIDVFLLKKYLHTRNDRK